MDLYLYVAMGMFGITCSRVKLISKLMVKLNYLTIYDILEMKDNITPSCKRRRRIERRLQII